MATRRYAKRFQLLLRKTPWGKISTTVTRPWPGNGPMVFVRIPPVVVVGGTRALSGCRTVLMAVA